MAAVRGFVAAVAGVVVVMMVMAVVVTEARVIGPDNGLSVDSLYRLKTMMISKAKAKAWAKPGFLHVWLQRFNDDDDDNSDSDSDPSSDVTSEEDDEGRVDEEKAGEGPLNPPPSRKRRSLYIDFGDEDDYVGGYRRYRPYGRYGRPGRWNRYGRYGRRRYGRYGGLP